MGARWNEQAICERVYRFKFSFDPQATWIDLELTLNAAQMAVDERCRIENLRLGGTNAVVGDLSEWKLYQLHKTAKKKDQRSKRDAGDGNLLASQ